MWLKTKEVKERTFGKTSCAICLRGLTSADLLTYPTKYYYQITEDKQERAKEMS